MNRKTAIEQIDAIRATLSPRDSEHVQLDQPADALAHAAEVEICEFGSHCSPTPREGYSTQTVEALLQLDDDALRDALGADYHTTDVDDIREALREYYHADHYAIRGDTEI